MAVVSVTDSLGTLVVSDGNSSENIPKSKVVVTSRGDNVKLQWGGSQYIDAVYTDFTAPTGASAAAVAASINAFLDTASLVVTLGAGTVNTGLIGANISVGVNITRSANTTTYAANDVMNNGTDTTPLIFAVSRANDLRGWIVSGMATSDAAQATLPNVDLMLFSSTFTIAADNAAFAPTNAQMATYLGKIRFSVWVNRGVRAESDGTLENAFIFSPASGTTNIYGVLVVQNAYVPVSAEVLRFIVNGEQY